MEKKRNNLLLTGLSRDLLYDLYVNQRISPEKIGKMFDVGGRAIRGLMENYGIPRGGPGHLRSGVSATWNKGLKRGVETNEKNRLAHTGKIPPHKWRGYITFNCVICGTLIHTRRAKFTCSPECRNKYMSIYLSGENHYNWKGGISCEPYCVQWTDKEYKNWIKFERDEGKCQNPYCNHKTTRLCLHHINYNKKDCRPANLICICICISCNGVANGDREWWESFYTEILERRISTTNF